MKQFLKNGAQYASKFNITYLHICLLELSGHRHTKFSNLPVLPFVNICKKATVSLVEIARRVSMLIPIVIPHYQMFKVVSQLLYVLQSYSCVITHPFVYVKDSVLIT